MARWQDRLTTLNARPLCGRHPNRSTLAGIRNAGFEVTATQLQHDTVAHSPPFMRPLIVGVAQA